MDKAKFIKKAKEYEYSDEEINEMIQDYENDLKAYKEGKKVFPINPIELLTDYKKDTSFTIPTHLLEKWKMQET